MSVIVSTVVPERSLAQKREALLKANVVRTTRADWKKAAARGEVSVRAVLVDPPELFGAMKVLDLLMAQPHVGRVKALKMLRVASCSPAKTVGGLSMRQRVELAAWLS
jgi:hypothetical protein